MSNMHDLSLKSWRIFSIIISAMMIVSFITPVTAKPADVLVAPIPIYPANYQKTNSVTDPPLGVPSFEWSVVTDAIVYRLQVDSEVGFNQPIVLDITTRNLTYTPQQTGHLFADGEWYWRVRVEEPAPVGDWSPIMRFTKAWATSDNKPTLLAPTDGANLAFFNSPAFSWTPVMGAARYRFQIATTPDGFDSPIYSADTLSSSHQPNNRFANGNYYWRVTGVDTADHYGTPSNVQLFNLAYGTTQMDMVPTLLEPEDEDFPTFTPTFRWAAVIGAEHYRLEYTSDETCNFSIGTSLETRQTYYTPTDTFSNDARYCWRVRVESGPALGDWSETRHFQKRWNLKPVLLTPTPLYQTGLYPLYSWTPVPGAARYTIQIATNPSFNPIYEESVTSNTTYAPQNRYDGTAHYYWRVRPIDGGGEYGVNSNVSEYQSVYTSTAPIQIYPLYYYPPNNYAGFSTNPYEDRTAAYPIFIWHRIMVPALTGGVYATAYRIQVDDTPYFSSPEWIYDTENTSATPTSSDDFTPAIGQDYYWRVCPLSGIDGDCLINPISGLVWWSQIWRARFDTSLALPPTSNPGPELLRPAHGQESVEATPMLEWWPFQGATQYQVEVSRDMNFSTDEISVTVNIPAYSPGYSIAQRSLGRTDYGTFYWRVRGKIGETWSSWSDTWRFQIASQSEWRYSRSLGDTSNRLLIGIDPVDNISPAYDLSTIYASQSNTHWQLGFNADISTTNMTYVFYIDLDHIDGSGATAPPERNYDVSTISAHQPEYVIYVDDVGGIINTENTWVFKWNGSSWGFGQRFVDIGASVFISPDYIELQIPNGAIGMNQDTSSASVMIFSIDTSTGELQDTVPSDPEVPGNAQLSRFTSVSERMNLVFPPSTVTGDPTTITSLLPFYWDWPTGSIDTTPFAGSILQVDLDQDYSPPHEATFQINSNTAYFGENNVTLLNDIVGDNIYYWRVQPRYWKSGNPEAFGAWAYGWSFHRLGFTAQNLDTSVTFSTPTFSWDLAEGADTYRLQVASDPNFGNRVIDITTPMNQYTPTDTLPQGLYYWRVQINRFPNIGNDWSQVEQFNLSLPTPTGLIPNNEEVHYAPTFCWDPLEGYDDDGELVLTAWKYHIQVSQDPGFSNMYDSVDTYNNCWTPTMGYHDGTFYWRVASIDGNGRMSTYTPPATFIKQYPITTLISPVNEPIQSTPTFIWTPVDGAATYVFEVSLAPTFYPVYDSLETINTRYTPTWSYISDRAYYWRVAIRDRSGRLGPFTDARIIIGDVYPAYLPLIQR